MCVEKIGLEMRVTVTRVCVSVSVCLCLCLCLCFCLSVSVCVHTNKKMKWGINIYPISFFQKKGLEMRMTVTAQLAPQQVQRVLSHTYTTHTHTTRTYTRHKRYTHTKH
jgi:hypothetical protein